MVLERVEKCFHYIHCVLIRFNKAVKSFWTFGICLSYSSAQLAAQLASLSWALATSLSELDGDNPSWATSWHLCTHLPSLSWKSRRVALIVCWADTTLRSHCWQHCWSWVGDGDVSQHLAIQRYDSFCIGLRLDLSSWLIMASIAWVERSGVWMSELGGLTNEKFAKESHLGGI